MISLTIKLVFADIDLLVIIEQCQGLQLLGEYVS